MDNKIKKKVEKYFYFFYTLHVTCNTNLTTSPQYLDLYLPNIHPFTHHFVHWITFLHPKRFVKFTDVAQR